jgi:hypothetical protein
MIMRFEASVVNLVTDALAARTVVALRADGVRAIVLKGASIREWLYSEKEERPSRDVDLLVPPSGRARVDAQLLTLGLRYIGPNKVGRGRSYEWLWQDPRTGTFVELHESISGIGATADKTWQVLSEHTAEMSIAGEHVEVLDLPRRALHLALHAAHHGPAYPRPIEDLERGIAALPEQTWHEAVDVARRLDAISALVAGLRLAAAAPDLLVSLGLANEVVSQVDVALRAAGAPPGAEGLAWLLETRGARAKAEIVAQGLVPPPSVMRAWSPLARRNAAGLAVMYLWRPLWLARHAIPALTAVRSASREASTTANRQSRAAQATTIDATEDAWLALRMLGWSLLLPLLKRTVPLRTLTRWMWANGADPRKPEREALIVRTSARLSTNCLERSLLAYRFLAQANAEPRLVAGVRRESSADVVGHAWVEVDGFPVHEGKGELRDFVPLVEFGIKGMPTERESALDPLPDRWM